MQTDVLIIGQGISGTMLSWFLYKEGKDFIVIDDNNEWSSSRIAAGVINPVTGRRYAYTWMIEELISFANSTYNEMSLYLNEDLLIAKSIIDFFPSAQMRNAFIDRLNENDTYLHSYPDQNHFNPYFNYSFGCGEIKPCYLVNILQLIKAWRKRLEQDNFIVPDRLDLKALEISEKKIKYKDISADKIIFCDGINAMSNPFFSLLPFAPNKGEALVIECEGLTNEHIYKKGLMLVPLTEENKFWLGSNYLWEFENDKPSDHFYKHATSVLDHWLKKPYKVLEHKAAVRPATIERRPFVGFHPVYNNVGILNGMGTKGTSLAPFFANQLAQNMIYELPIDPDANISRFTRILSKSI
jgi:glycine/D-amino acid oxidase-like deaminating enzyme